MEKKKKLSTGAIIGIIVLAVLSVAGLICSFVGTIQNVGFLDITPGLVAWVILFIAITYYALAGYKLPHGNLLRYIFILLGLTFLNGVIDSAKYMTLFEGTDQNWMQFIVGLEGFSLLLIAYIGGRLDKINKNYLPMILITLAQIVKSILFIILFGAWPDPVHIVWDFSTCILWVDVMFAYILRYKEHKEAGLADKN